MGKRPAIKTVRRPELPVEAAMCHYTYDKTGLKAPGKARDLQEVLSSQTTSLWCPWQVKNYRDMENQAQK